MPIYIGPLAWTLTALKTYTRCLCFVNDVLKLLVNHIVILVCRHNIVITCFLNIAQINSGLNYINMLGGPSESPNIST